MLPEAAPTAGSAARATSAATAPGCTTASEFTKTRICPVARRVRSARGDAAVVAQEVEFEMSPAQQARCAVSGNAPLLLYCRSGARSARAAGLLRRAGYRDVQDLGGLGSARVVLGGADASE